MIQFMRSPFLCSSLGNSWEHGFGTERWFRILNEKMHKKNSWVWVQYMKREKTCNSWSVFRTHFRRKGNTSSQRNIQIPEQQQGLRKDNWWREATTYLNSGSLWGAQWQHGGWRSHLKAIRQVLPLVSRGGDGLGSSRRELFGWKWSQRAGGRGRGGGRGLDWQV